MLEVFITNENFEISNKDGTDYTVAFYILVRDIVVWICEKYENRAYSGCGGSYTTKREYWV